MAPAEGAEGSAAIQSRQAADLLPKKKRTNGTLKTPSAEKTSAAGEEATSAIYASLRRCGRSARPSLPKSSR